MDYVHFKHRVSLLHILDEVPATSIDNGSRSFYEESRTLDDRVMSIRQERELVGAFAFLASVSDDPRKVIAIAVEERRSSLVVRIAVNRGELVALQTELQRLSGILERVANKELDSSNETQAIFFQRVVAVHQNRILARLRSKHAVLRCQYKRQQQGKPKIIVQLHNAIRRFDVEGSSSKISASDKKALSAGVGELLEAFVTLEEMPTGKARSLKGQAVLLRIVTLCHRIYASQTIAIALSATSTSDAGSKEKLTATLAKLSRYWTVSKFLVQFAKRCALLSSIWIETLHITAQEATCTAPDRSTRQTIKRVLSEANWQRFLAKKQLDSESQVRRHICQEASEKHPVHAEIQLLWHYEMDPPEVRPRVISSSKKACFLCNLFFECHGGYAMPATHGRLYTKWGLAKTGTAKDWSASLDITLRKLSERLEGKLQATVGSPRKVMVPPHESTIFPSAACSYTNRSQSVPSILEEDATCGSLIRNDATAGSHRSHLSTTELKSTPISNIELDMTRLSLEKYLHTSEKSGSGASTKEFSGREASETRSSQSQEWESKKQLGYSPTLSPVDSSSNDPDESHQLYQGVPFRRRLYGRGDSVNVTTARMRLTVALGEQSSPITLCPRSPANSDGPRAYDMSFEFHDKTELGDTPNGILVDIDKLISGAEATFSLGEDPLPRTLQLQCGTDVITITYNFI